MFSAMPFKELVQEYELNPSPNVIRQITMSTRGDILLLVQQLEYLITSNNPYARQTACRILALVVATPQLDVWQPKSVPAAIHQPPTDCKSSPHNLPIASQNSNQQKVRHGAKSLGVQSSVAGASLVLLEFFLARLDDTLSVQFLLDGILALLVQQMLSLTDQLLVPPRIFTELSVASLPRPQRLACHRIFAALFAQSLRGLRRLGSDFVHGLLASSAGEQDPAILLLVLSNMALAVQHLDLAQYSDQTFDFVSSYFPITYNAHADQQALNVDPQRLKTALRNALMAPAFAKSCVPFLLEKLSSTAPLAQIDALDVLAAGTLVYTPTVYMDHLTEAWALVKPLVAAPSSGANYPKLLSSSLNFIHAVGKCATFAPIVSNSPSPIDHIMDAVVADCATSLDTFEGKFLRESGMVLVAVAGSSAQLCLRVCRLVVPKIIAKLEGHGDEISTNAVKAQMLELVGDLLACVVAMPDLDISTIAPVAEIDIDMGGAGGDAESAENMLERLASIYLVELGMGQPSDNQDVKRACINGVQQLVVNANSTNSGDDQMAVDQHTGDACLSTETRSRLLDVLLAISLDVTPGYQAVTVGECARKAFAALSASDAHVVIKVCLPHVFGMLNGTAGSDMQTRAVLKTDGVQRQACFDLMGAVSQPSKQVAQAVLAFFMDALHDACMDVNKYSGLVKDVALYCKFIETIICNLGTETAGGDYCSDETLLKLVSNVISTLGPLLEPSANLDLLMSVGRIVKEVSNSMQTSLSQTALLHSIIAYCKRTCDTSAQDIDIVDGWVPTNMTASVLITSALIHIPASGAEVNAPLTCTEIIRIVKALSKLIFRLNNAQYTLFSARICAMLVNKYIHSSKV